MDHKSILWVCESTQPIYAHLQWQECLLRTSEQNYCLINWGSPPAIVMGISGKEEELVEETATLLVLRRFSGGGCVVVDENTLFLTLILARGLFPKVSPQAFLEWHEPLYAPCKLRAQDYCIGQKKVAGNAQYFTKDRVLQHTTFLCDYNPCYMEQLKLPSKQPDYRQQRSHEDFLTTFAKEGIDPKTFVQKYLERLAEHFTLASVRLTTQRLRSSAVLESSSCALCE